MVFTDQRVKAALDEPVDGASLAFFRAAFGLLMVVLSLRFFTHGWVDADYRAPKVFFTYWGFGWVHPWPGVGMHLHYAVMTAAAGAITLGVAYRPACLVFALAFTYAHLCDKSNYLNHYYLVSLVSALMGCLPLDREGSLRAWRSPSSRRPLVRRWVLLLLQFQIAIVYAFGGVAKIGCDWLIHAEPLRIWLPANGEGAVLGAILHHRWVAYAFSWGGAAFDLSIVPLLLLRRTRPVAYLTLLAFHAVTAVLFRIGMFPWIMSVSATLFFDPAWPRRVVPWLRGAPVVDRSAIAGAPLHRARLVLIATYALVQIAMPLRHFAYPGNTLWSEEGFRFAWKVMLIEKSGELMLRVVDARGREVDVDPRAYLTPFQARMASTQPDMILALAHIVARDFDARGVGPVRVYADARVSFNGRRAAVLVDPAVDLATQTDGLRSKTWVRPAPESTPEF